MSLAKRRKKIEEPGQVPGVKNYGYMWRRSVVDWGWQGANGKGTLIGVTKGKLKNLVDFRDQVGVYVLYDDSFRPVYVGQAGGRQQKKLFDRLRDHTKNNLRNRWEYFSWFGLRRVNKSLSLSKTDKATTRVSIQLVDMLDLVEGVLIQVLEPAHNKQGARWKKTVPYVQPGDNIFSEVDFVMLGELDEIKARLDGLERILKSQKGNKVRG